jgi:hypothetical protein
MSHHLDTPLASQNGQLYIDDLYVFQGIASTVFIMDVNSNITGVHVKPGFHSEARYEFKVHFDGPQLRPGNRIGLWGATKLATDAGGWRQINRAGHPMMWPIFWPDDTHFTNPANTRHPSEDFDAEGMHIAEHIAAVVAASGTSDDPQGYGETVARELFPDVLPYVVGTPATYGFTTRNGRTLADNAPEVMLSLVAGTAVPSGLKPSIAKHLRDNKFPYVVPT